MGSADPRLHSPAAERNKGPILTALLRRLPATGRALEIASGTGQHVVHFATGMPGWFWQPSDAEATALASINALTAAARLRNVATPLAIDLLAAACVSPWPAPPLDLVYCANLLHISAWATCAALMRGSAASVGPQGLLVTYGPYRIEGEPLQPGNQAFDADLRARNPAWGLRWLHDVAAEAAAAGLALQERVVMPTDNLMLIFARADAGPAYRLRIEPAGWEVAAPASRSLLASAQQAGIRLPSSCRNGSCRTCLCRLRDGQVRYAVEWPGLSPEEKAEGWTLPCVAHPLSDLVLESPAAQRAGQSQWHETRPQEWPFEVDRRGPQDDAA